MMRVGGRNGEVDGEEQNQLGKEKEKGRKGRKLTTKSLNSSVAFAQILSGEVDYLAGFVEYVLYLIDHEPEPLSGPIPDGCQPYYGLSACCR